MTALLGTQLNAVSAEDFNAESGSVIATTLKHDGMLSAPPKVLVGSNAAQGVGRDAVEFQNQWRVVVDHIRNGYPMSTEDTEQLEAAFAKWETSAKLALEACPRLERVQAKQYLSRLAALVAKMKQERSDEVMYWIGGNGFPGGTVGDLMQHMTSHRLTLRFGSEAHLALQQVAIQWAGELDKQLADLDIEITNVTAANPAHHAALKTIIQQDATSDAASEKALITKADN